VRLNIAVRKAPLNPKLIGNCTLLSLLVLLLSWGAAAIGVQQETETFFKTTIGLPDGDIQKMNHGQVVTKLLESGDKKYGILVFGGVRIDAPIDAFATAYRNVKNLLDDKVYLDVQDFAEADAPPRLSDFDRLTFDRKDIDAIQKCKPRHCDLQVFDVSAFQKQIGWNSGDRYDQANRLARQRIYEGITKFLSGGLISLGSYKDREKPFSLYLNMKSMLDSAYWLFEDRSGGIYHHILDYPDGKLPGAMDFFYWEDIDFGQGPTIRVNRVSMFPNGVGAAKYVVANQQLYASRYIRIALQVFYCVPDAQDPAKPAFYLIDINDSRLPDFGGLKFTAARKIATASAIDSTRDMLNLYLQRLTAK
jgi:hypothetical protein